MIIHCETLIHASAKALFELTQDYAKRALWDPFTPEAHLIHAAVPGEGAIARCTDRHGFSMDTVYVSYRPDEVAAVKMVKGPYIFDQFAGGWRFKALSPTETLVKFRYNLRAKPRGLSWLLTPLLGWIFRYETLKRLRALKRYAESNAAIDRELIPSVNS